MLKPKNLIRHFYPTFDLDEYVKITPVLMFIYTFLVTVSILFLLSRFSLSRKFGTRKLKELKAKIFHNGIIRFIILSSLKTSLVVGNSYQSNLEGNKLTGS